MPRIDLNVPFSEKEEAKKLGAKWDADKKVWYIPDGIPSSALSRWMTEEDDKECLTSVTSNGINVAVAKQECWQCKIQSEVFGIVLIHPNYVLTCESEFDNEDVASLVASGEPHIMCYTQFLSDNVVQLMRQIAPKFFLDNSKMAETQYWMNHCQHCGAKFGDFFLIEDDGPLATISEEESKMIVIRQFDGELKGTCQSLGHFMFLKSMKVQAG